jgi:hypothetical protein
MEVVALLLYVGAVWVLGAVGLFAWNLRTSGHEHEERLALLPLQDNWTDPLLQRGPALDTPSAKKD